MSGDRAAAAGLPTTAARELGGVHRRTPLAPVALALGGASRSLAVAVLVLARTLDVLPTSYFADGRRRHHRPRPLDERRAAQVPARPARPPHALRDRGPHRPRRVLRQRVRDVPAGHADRGAPAAAAVLRAASRRLRPARRRRGGARPAAPRTRACRARGSRRSAAARGSRPGSPRRGGSIEREGDPNLPVMLVSDLDDSAFDTSALTEELIAYETRRNRPAGRPALPAFREDRSCSSGSSARSAFVQRDELLRNTRVRGAPDGRRRVPVARSRSRRGAPAPARAERARLCARSPGGRRVSARTSRSPIAVRRRRVRRGDRSSSLLAADVLRWKRVERRRRDVRFARRRHDRRRGTPTRSLPAGRLRRAARRRRRRRVPRGGRSASGWRKPREPVRAVRADVTRRSGRRAASSRRLARRTDARRAGRSLPNLRGALAARGGAKLGPTQRPVFVRRAIEQFRRAVTLDPANDDARLQPRARAEAAARGRGRAGRRAAARSPTPGPGAGAATSGRGF